MIPDHNRPKKVLVVEDDVHIRETLMEVLESEGYEAFGAGNGQEALIYLQSAAELPSLILLDVMMPVMDGWQFRSAQALDTKLGNIPVVVVTADGNAQEKAKKMNAHGWVKKPIELDSFIETVKKFSP